MAVRAIENQVAFESMWDAHLDAIRRLLISLARDIDLADDLLQETWLRAQAGFSAYRGGDVRAWLAAIARNVFLTHARRHYLRVEVPLDEQDEMEAPAPACDLHDLLAIRQALETLTPVLRMALLMKHYAGCTYREIARRQRCPVGTAKWRVSEALDRLRRVLLPERSIAMAEHEIDLVEYVYGVLPAEKMQEARAHLEECERCRREAKELQRVVSLLDALEGGFKQMHFVELDEEGLITLFASNSIVNDADQSLTTVEFASGAPVDQVYVDGTEAAFTEDGVWHSEFGDVPRFLVTLPRPVKPGERFSELLVFLPKPDGMRAERVGEGRFRLHWNQNPNEPREYAYVQAIRLPAGATLTSAEPMPEETRGDGALTLVWRRVLPPMQAFECVIEYQLG